MEQIDRVGWDILYHGSDSAESKNTGGVDPPIGTNVAMHPNKTTVKSEFSSVLTQVLRISQVVLPCTTPTADIHPLSNVKD